MSTQNKLFIGNLPFQTTEDKLRDLFVPFGSIVEISIPTHRETGRPRGFAFLTFETPKSAQEALSLDGRDLDGRKIKVSMAQAQKRTGERTGGGSGGYRGGRGGDRDSRGNHDRY